MRDALSRSPVTLASSHEDEPLPSYVASVLDSQCFQKTPALRSLLRYLWDHRNEQISEYAIATEALGRSSLFNAKTDATVRVQISRLRQRLEKFYEAEGQTAGTRLVIPLGTHQLSVEPALLAPPPNLGASVSRRAPGLVPVLAGVCVILLVACATLAIQLARRPAPAAPSAPIQARFWRTFFANGVPTRTILPTPVFMSYRYPGDKSDRTIMVRDTVVNDFSARNGSRPLQLLDENLGHADLSQSYTVASDTFAALKLARYLDNSGFLTSVHSSADAVLESLDSENVIAIGTWGTLTPIKMYLDKLQYRLAPGEKRVNIQQPLPGEPKSIVEIDEASDRAIWPGIIAFLPGRNGRTHLLVLASRYTAALVSFLTSTAGMDQLDRIWHAKGSPAYYQLVVNAEINGNDRAPVRFWPVSLHAIPAEPRP
jgi:hypothetical protein